MALHRRDALKLFGLGAAGAAALQYLGYDPAHAAPVSGGTMNFVVTPEPPTISNVTTVFGSTQRIAMQVLEGLIGVDLDYKPFPRLAESWSNTEDGLRYTFKLRQGVKFHDGKPMTSADVAFSIKLAKEYQPNGRTTFANLVDVLTPDTHTVEIVLSKPLPYLLTAMIGNETPIVPKHLWENTDVRQNPQNTAPVGTGPFVFKEWVRGSHIILDRNPDYWDNPRPYLDRIVVRFIPDVGARTIAFETGDVDIGGDTPIQREQIERIGALPHIGLERRGHAYNPIMTMMVFNLDDPIMGKAKVRQAFAHTINKETILRIAWNNYGVVATGPITPEDTRFYEPDVTTYELDNAKAEKLLDEAGHPRGADGVRFRVTMDHLPLAPGYLRTAEITKQLLKRIGVEVDIRSEDQAAFQKRIFTDRAFSFSYQASGNAFDPSIGVGRIFHSTGFRPGVPFSNGSHYANPEVDKLLDEALATVDQSRRAELFSGVQKIITQDLPHLEIAALWSFTVFNKKVKDHLTSFSGTQEAFGKVYFEN